MKLLLPIPVGLERWVKGLESGVNFELRTSESWMLGMTIKLCSILVVALKDVPSQPGHNSYQTVHNEPRNTLQIVTVHG